MRAIGSGRQWAVLSVICWLAAAAGFVAQRVAEEQRLERLERRCGERPLL